MPDRDPLQSNTPLALARESPVPKGGSILSDRIGHLLARQTKNRRNPLRLKRTRTNGAHGSCRRRSRYSLTRMM